MTKRKKAIEESLIHRDSRNGLFIKESRGEKELSPDESVAEVLKITEQVQVKNGLDSLTSRPVQPHQERIGQ